MEQDLAAWQRCHGVSREMVLPGIIRADGPGALLHTGWLGWVRVRAGSGHCPTVLVVSPLTPAGSTDGAVYVLGGMGADTSPQALVRVYEPAKDHWQPLPSMPTPCYGASAFLEGNKIFVLGR